MASLIGKNIILINLVIVVVAVVSCIPLFMKKNYKGIIITLCVGGVLMAATSGVTANKAGALADIGKDVAGTVTTTTTSGNILK